jgi:hypothetical protein
LKNRETNKNNQIVVLCFPRHDSLSRAVHIVSPKRVFEINEMESCFLALLAGMTWCFTNHDPLLLLKMKCLVDAVKLGSTEMVDSTEHLTKFFFLSQFGSRKIIIIAKKHHLYLMLKSRLLFTRMSDSETKKTTLWKSITKIIAHPVDTAFRMQIPNLCKNFIFRTLKTCSGSKRKTSTHYTNLESKSAGHWRKKIEFKKTSITLSI